MWRGCSKRQKVCSDGRIFQQGIARSWQNAYRIVARNRDHIRYVANRESELADKGALAYEALISFNGDESTLATVDSYLVAVSKVRLAFESLK